MRHQIEVEVGQRYSQHFVCGPHKQTWEVASISPDGVGLPHARLFNVNNPNEMKTLSYAALNGQYGFKPLRI